MPSGVLSRSLEAVAPQLLGVERELDRLLDSDVPVVRSLAEHVGQGRGKRLRPTLLLLGTAFLGYEGAEDVRLAAVYELIHTATLVHDDVIDHADTRRARPALHRVWGSTLTVLFGDLLYIRAMDSAIRARNFRVLEVLADVTARMIEGELMQHHLLFQFDITREDYFGILERKTALLFGGCMETAALLAGRDSHECHAFRDFGLALGRAFQLVDDLLDFCGTPEELGKPALSDLREGKLTLPMLTLRDRAPREVQDLVGRIWGRSAPMPEDAALAAELLSLLETHGALQEARDRAEAAARSARAELDKVPGDPALRALLAEIPDALLVRRR